MASYPMAAHPVTVKQRVQVKDQGQRLSIKITNLSKHHLQYRITVLPATQNRWMRSTKAKADRPVFNLSTPEFENVIVEEQMGGEEDGIGDW